MAILQVRELDDNLYSSLRNLAERDKRSISQEVVHILESYLSSSQAFAANPTDEFLKLAGSWQDKREAATIAADIRADRRDSERFKAGHGVFD